MDNFKFVIEELQGATEDLAESNKNSVQRILKAQAMAEAACLLDWSKKCLNDEDKARANDLVQFLHDEAGFLAGDNADLIYGDCNNG